MQRTMYLANDPIALTAISPAAAKWLDWLFDIAWEMSPDDAGTREVAVASLLIGMRVGAETPQFAWVALPLLQAVEEAHHTAGDVAWGAY